MQDLNGGEVGVASAAIEGTSRVGGGRLGVVTGTAPARAPDLALQVIEEVRELDALEEEWNALLDRSEASVFQSFEWQRTWWRHFGEGRSAARLHVVTLRDADGLVAVAPFYVERVRVLGVLRLSRLLFLGHRDSDYLDILVARGSEAECVARIAAYLTERRDGVDVAVLEETTDRSLAGPLLHEALRRRGWAASRFVEQQCPRTALRGTWEETVASFPINYRREIRRRLRNIAKAYDVQLEVVRPGPEVEPAMREFIAMHQERWERGGYLGAFADPRVAAFHREVAERLSRRGWLFLAFLRVDGRRCAANYGFSFRDAVSTYLGGEREVGDLRRYSPGRVLHAKSLESAIAAGATVYDFMRGTEHYKYEFDAADVPNWTVVAYRRSPLRTAVKHRLDLLLGKVQRRAGREAQAFVATARNRGWLSGPMMRHVARRLRRGLADVVRNLRWRGARASP